MLVLLQSKSHSAPLLSKTVVHIKAASNLTKKKECVVQFSAEPTRAKLAKNNDFESCPLIFGLFCYGASSDSAETAACPNKFEPIPALFCGISSGTDCEKASLISPRSPEAAEDARTEAAFAWFSPTSASSSVASASLTTLRKVQRRQVWGTASQADKALSSGEVDTRYACVLRREVLFLSQSCQKGFEIAELTSECYTFVRPTGLPVLLLDTCRSRPAL